MLGVGAGVGAAATLTAVGNGWRLEHHGRMPNAEWPNGRLVTVYGLALVLVSAVFFSSELMTASFARDFGFMRVSRIDLLPS